MNQATKDKLEVIAKVVPVLQELRHLYDRMHQSSKEALDMLPRKTADDTELWLHAWRQSMKELNQLSRKTCHIAGVVSDLTEDVLIETGYRNLDESPQ